MRVDCFLDFPTDFFPLFLSLSLSSYFPFYCAFISYFCFGIACSLRAFGKRQGQSRFSEPVFSSLFGHWKASGVLPVYVLGLMLQAYKVMVLTHTKKSTLIESVNK